MWNLSESELLLTVAELSVAFAGFASLASILGRRMGRDDPRVDAGRLLNMLTVSLTLTVLSLVPFLPMMLEWSERWTWGVSGGFGVVVMVMASRIMVRRAAYMKQFPGFNQAANVANSALSILATIGFLCSALDLPSSNAFAAYFASIISMLVLCAILFYRVIASLLQPAAARAEAPPDDA